MTYRSPTVPCGFLALVLLPTPMLNCQGLDAPPLADGALYTLKITGAR